MVISFDTHVEIEFHTFYWKNNFKGTLLVGKGSFSGIPNCWVPLYKYFWWKNVLLQCSGALLAQKFVKRTYSMLLRLKCGISQCFSIQDDGFQEFVAEPMLYITLNIFCRTGPCKNVVNICTNLSSVVTPFLTILSWQNFLFHSHLFFCICIDITGTVVICVLYDSEYDILSACAWIENLWSEFRVS